MKIAPNERERERKREGERKRKREKERKKERINERKKTQRKGNITKMKEKLRKNDQTVTSVLHEKLFTHLLSRVFFPGIAFT